MVEYQRTWNFAKSYLSLVSVCVFNVGLDCKQQVLESLKMKQTKTCLFHIEFFPCARKIQEEHITNIFCLKTNNRSHFPFCASRHVCRCCFIVPFFCFVLFSFYLYTLFGCIYCCCCFGFGFGSCSPFFLCHRCIFCYNQNWVCISMYLNSKVEYHSTMSV